VLQAEHQLIAQNANIGAARAAFFPRLSLTATGGTIATAIGKLFGSGTDTYTVSPTASVNIFDFGKNQANLDYYKAAREGAVARATRRRSRRRFAKSPTRWPNAGRSTSRSARRPPAHRRRKWPPRLSDARYRAGVDSFLTALDSQRSAYAAEQQLVTTRLNRASNLVTLYRTLGGGLD
jgi:multidrug efflux system outer membrane protein